MGRNSLQTETCSVAKAIGHIGDEWSLMIVRELMLGTRRFDPFFQQTGMSTHILARRLKNLEELGVIRKTAYSERPLRYEYRLTDMGRDLWPVIVSLKKWSETWLTEDETPIQLVHKACGNAIVPQLVCPDCGEPLSARDITPVLSDALSREREEKLQRGQK